MVNLVKRVRAGAHHGDKHMAGVRGAALASIKLGLLAASCIQVPSTPSSSPQAAQRAITPAEDAAHPGKAIYDKACSGCHNNPESTRAPGLASLRLMRKSSVEYTL